MRLDIVLPVWFNERNKSSASLQLYVKFVGSSSATMIIIKVTIPMI